MVKSQVHTLVNVGSNPAAATKSRDSVTGNTPVSKTGILSSNLNPFANYGAVGKWLSHLTFDQVIAGSNPVSTSLGVVGRMVFAAAF